MAKHTTVPADDGFGVAPPWSMTCWSTRGPQSRSRKRGAWRARNGTVLGMSQYASGRLRFYEQIGKAAAPVAGSG